MRTADIRRHFERLEESCVPSYCHRNPISAYTAWWRLFAARDLAVRHASWGPTLDFGAGTCELADILPERTLPYHFVEQNIALEEFIPSPARAEREYLEELGDGVFRTVFALDSLEHNENPEGVIEKLHRCLAPSLDSLLVVSGPTENALYRFGRWVSGFHGHYHHHNIWDIHRQLATFFDPVEQVVGPLKVPLFAVSAWRPKRGPA